jgi:hypothetical protein
MAKKKGHAGLRPGEVIIHEGNAHLFADDPVVDGERRARGLVPRNYDTHPLGCYASVKPFHAVEIPLIPRAEWSERIKDKVAQKSQLSDIRLTGNDGKPIPSLDQDGVGYCWAHSSTHAVMVLRALMNAPYVPLSAFCVAATIKHGADQGGWGAESLDFITERGVCSQALWPQGDRDYRKHDQPETWADAAKHKVTEGWVDLQAAQYDRNLSFEQEISLYLANNPVIKDENWWGHSIDGLDPVDGTTDAARRACRSDSGKKATKKEYELIWGLNDPVTAGIGVRIWNSWSDSWGDRGMGVLTGSKAVSDGAVAPRVTVA